MSNHMIKNVEASIEKAFADVSARVLDDEEKYELSIAAIQALKEDSPNSFISEIINKYAGLNPMDEHGRKLWNNLIDAVLNMKEKT